MGADTGKDFARVRDTFGYRDGDIVLLNEDSGLQRHETSSLGQLFLILCTEGFFHIKVNGKVQRISRGDILICPPGVELGTPHSTQKYDIRILGMSYVRFLQGVRSGRSVWTIMMYARTNPVFHLDRSDMELTECYYQVIRRKMATARSFYYDEIMQSLMQCAIYEICVVLNRSLGTPDNEGSSTRKDVIFKKFVELLAESEGKVRSVNEFASRLCVTPKYLSAVTLSISGMSALELILQNAAHIIRHELEFSASSITEISDRFGFPDLSVFGKFVKSRLGASPRRIRAGLPGPKIKFSSGV